MPKWRHSWINIYIIFNYVHVISTAEHMFRFNSGATLRHDDSRQYTHGFPSLSYIQLLQGIHTLLCMSLPIYFTAASRPWGLHPSSLIHWAIPPQTEMRTHGHDTSIMTVQLYAKLNFLVSPELWKEFRFKGSMSRSIWASLQGCLKHYLGLSLDPLFVLPLNTPGGKR